MILLVDDDPVIRLLVSEYLNALGHEVHATSCGQEFFAALATNSPALCVIDMQLPDMTGLQIVERLRADRSSVPVLVLSANSDTAMLLERAGVSYQGIVAKPFEPRILAAEVGRLLGTKAHR